MGAIAFSIGVTWMPPVSSRTVCAVETGAETGLIEPSVTVWVVTVDELVATASDVAGVIAGAVLARVTTVPSGAVWTVARVAFIAVAFNAVLAIAGAVFARVMTLPSAAAGAATKAELASLASDADLLSADGAAPVFAVASLPVITTDTVALTAALEVAV